MTEKEYLWWMRFYTQDKTDFSIYLTIFSVLMNLMRAFANMFVDLENLYGG